MCYSCTNGLLSEASQPLIVQGGVLLVLGGTDSCVSVNSDLADSSCVASEW